LNKNISKFLETDGKSQSCSKSHPDHGNEGDNSEDDILLSEPSPFFSSAQTCSNTNSSESAPASVLTNFQYEDKQLINVRQSNTTSERQQNIMQTESHSNPGNEDDDSDDDPLLSQPSPFFSSAPKILNANSFTSESTSVLTNSQSENTKLTSVRQSNITTERRQNIIQTKSDKKAQKESERALAKLKREELKRKREEEKAHAKKQKEREMLLSKQDKGKFAPSEIFMCAVHNCEECVEEGNIKDIIDKYKEGCSYKFHLESYNNLVSKQTHSIPDKGSIFLSWTRREHVAGGAAPPPPLNGSAKNDVEMDDDERYCGIEELRFYVVLFHNPANFLELLDEVQSHDSNDFSQLHQWANELRGSNLIGRCDFESEAASSSKKYLLLLPGIREEIRKRWTDYGRSNRKKSVTAVKPSVDDDRLEEAIAYLLLEEQIECTMFPPGPTEVTDYLRSLTRALSEAPYYEEATDLHCVKKIKRALCLNQLYNDSSSNYGCAKKADEVARDTWYRMLQKIPRVSSVAASNIIRHFPTLRSLMDIYFDKNCTRLTSNQKKLALANSVDMRTTRATLSESVYRLFMSQDPDELI